MGARHRQRRADQPAFFTEAREIRKAQHRAQRHSVRQALREASVEGELESVVLAEPRPTRGRIAPADRGEPKISSGTFKPWKLPFWKRRFNERQARAQAWQALAAD